MECYFNIFTCVCQAFFSCFSHCLQKVNKIFSEKILINLLLFEAGCAILPKDMFGDRLHLDFLLCVSATVTRTVSTVSTGATHDRLSERGGILLPNIKSAKKRVLVTDTKTMRNRSFKTAMKTVIKKYDAALVSGDMEAAQAAYKLAVKKIDQAVAKGLIHKNAGARKKSQFTLRLNALA